MKGRQPDVVFVAEDKKKHRTLTIRAWQELGLCWRDLQIPLRFIRYEQEIHYWQYEGREKTQVRETTPMWVVTSIGADVASMKTVWEMMHHRWDLENCGFYQLKTYSHLDHCFVHDATAIEANLRIMILAYNLFQLFLFRNIRSFRTLNMPQVALVEDMWVGLQGLRKSLAPVLWEAG